MSFLYETPILAETGWGSGQRLEEWRPISYFYYKINSTDRNTKNSCLHVSDHSQLTAWMMSFQFGNRLPNTLSLARGQAFKHKNQKPACHRWSVTIGRGLGAWLQGGPDVRPQHSWASCCCWRDKSFEGKTQSNGCQDLQRLGSIWQGGHAEQVVQSSGAQQGWGAGVSWTQGRGGRCDPNQVRCRSQLDTGDEAGDVIRIKSGAGVSWTQGRGGRCDPNQAGGVGTLCSSVTQSCLTPCDPMTVARQASLSFTTSQSLLKLMSIESVMPSNRLILCHPLLFLPSVFPSIRIFSNELVPHIRWPAGVSASESVLPMSIQD